jgi:autotransporter-associated beta strand protein
MKPDLFNRFLSKQLLAAVCVTTPAYAAPAIKSAAGTNLTLAASWTGGSGPGFPTSDDVATWNSSSLGPGLTAATDVAWGSINVSGATGAIGISGVGKIITGNVTLAGVTTLSVSNPVELSGNSIHHIADVTANANADFTASGIISGDFGITKSGAGTLKFSGANTYTGDTTLTGGVLLLDYSSQNNHKIAASSALTLGGGSLTLSGNTVAATTQTVASTTLNPGSATITLTKTTVAALPLTLNLGEITRNSGGTLNVVYTGSGLSPSATTETLDDDTGILGTWASFGSGASTRYATVGSGSFAGYVGAFADTAADLASDATVNYELATASGTVAPNFSANTIRYTGAAGTTAPDATSFTVNGLMNAGTGIWTIGASPLTIGASRELVVNAANNGITLSSGIANNGLGASALTKTGTNVLTLSGVNTYTGKTTIAAGTLAFTTTDSLYNSTSSSWTKENITVDRGATLALNTGGAGEFSGSHLTALFSDLTTATNNNGLKAGSTFSLNLATSSAVTTSLTDSTGAVSVGLLGAGALTLENSNLSATFTKANAGTLTLNNSVLSGPFTGSAGIVNLHDSASRIGGSINSTVSWNSSALRQSAGTLRLEDVANASVSGTNATFILGSTVSTYASYELSGNGRLEAVNPWRFNPRNSQITQTGGVIDISYTGNGNVLADARQFIIGTGSIRGVVYATGGTTTITTSNMTSAAPALFVSDSTSAAGAELTLDDTADWTLSGPAGWLAVSRNTNDVGHLTLNGGSRLTTNQITKGGGKEARLNFDGGTLRAGEDHASFLTGLDSVRIYAGGAKIDTNGKKVTIGQSLVNPGGDVVTAIPVATGGSGYTGAPIVSITGGGGTGATAVANYDPVAGTVTGITLTNPGSDYSGIPAVTIAGGNGSGATLDTANITLGAAVTTGGLEKLGSGTLTLSNASTYAGGTIVNAGTLLVTNGLDSATGTGSVTVKNTATFGGNGNVSGAVILESGATLAPGASIGLLDTGALTLPAGATLAAEIDSSTTVADAVNVTGNVTLGGSLAAIDAATVPAAITPGTKLTLITYSGTLIGTFTGKPEASTFAVGANLFKIRYADAGRVTLEAMGASSGYAAWANANAPSQSDTLDHDQDGVANGVEYVVGGSATTNDAGKLPTISTSGGNLIFRFVRSQASKTADTAVSIQVGTTLDSWTSHPVPATGTLGPVVVADIGGGFETVTLTLPQAPDAKKFARLHVVVSP